MRKLEQKIRDKALLEVAEACKTLLPVYERFDFQRAYAEGVRKCIGKILSAVDNNNELTVPQVLGGFNAWMKESRIPPIRREHHRKTWDRAQLNLLTILLGGLRIEQYYDDVVAVCDKMVDVMGDNEDHPLLPVLNMLMDFIEEYEGADFQDKDDK